MTRDARRPIAPTPLVPMPDLSRHLGGPRLLIKRDDLLPFGGAKYRKAVAAIGEARAAGGTAVVTEGSLESSHARALAIAASRAGLRCVLVVSPERGDETVPSLVDEPYGAEVLCVSSAAARPAAVRRTLQRLEREGERPVRVPFSGSTPVATLAYVHAFDEVMAQARERRDGIDAIVLACGTGGMQAGLELGSRRDGRQVKVVGVSPGLPVPAIRRRIARLMIGASRLLGESTVAAGARPIVLDRYVGPGYLRASAASGEAARLFAELEGVKLDPVYTAKAAAGLIDQIQSGAFERRQTVVFWHSAG